MAGPGKTPKPRHMLSRPGSRQVVEYDGPVVEGTPELLHPEGADWHPATLRWWGGLWAGPSKSEYVLADVDPLTRLALLIDRYWTTPTVALAAEIRLQEARFGLDPISRRRLHTEVRRSKADEPERNRKRQQTKRDREDPRHLLDSGLKVVK